MKTLLSKKLTAFLVAVMLALACLTVGFVLIRPVKAESTFTTEQSLGTTYEQGEVITIPKGSFTVSGNTVDAEIFVIFPDGAKKRTDGFLLEQQGKYTVIYTATVNGETLTQEKSFNCYATKTSINSLNSTVEYEERAFINYNKTSDKTDSGYQETVIGGLNVKLTQNATFYYNSIIDVSGYDGTTPLFSYYSEAVRNAYPVWLMLTVRLTDIYDPTNYIEILYDKYGSLNLDSKMPAYIRARVGEQPSMGLNGTQLKKDYYGCWTPATWDYKLATTGNQVDKSIGFYLDYAGKKVYNYLGSLVADLASTDYFPTPWQGFTTGEVYLSVYASEFNDSEGNIFITNIGGDTGATLGEQYLVDNDSPLISVDFDGYEQTKLPVAVVNQPYKVFTATALDFYSGVKSLKTNIYYNYNSTEKISVTLDGDCFTPKYEGAYTIEYLAEDKAGNTKSYIVNVACVNKVGTGIAITADGTGDNFGYVARDIVLSNYEVSNASGRYTVEITATKGDKTQVIDAEELIFNTKEAGNYTITYKVTDYVNCVATYSYEIAVTPDNDPVFLTSVVMPKYLLAGCNQILPTLVAYDYKNGGAEVKTSIIVKADGMSDKVLTTNTFAPDKAYIGKTLTIVYKATTATGESVQEYTVDCVSVLKDLDTDRTPSANISNNIDKSSLFVTSERVTASYGKVTASDTSEYSAYSFSQDGTIAYVNPLLASNFSIQFNITQGNFGKFNVYMTDSVDSTQRVKCTFINRGSVVGFKLNDGIEYRLSKQSFEKPQVSFYIEYDWFDAEILLENGDTAFALTDGISKYFTSGKIYYEMEMLEVTGESKIVIQKIRNQTLTTSTRDNGAPEGSLLGEYKRNYDLGAVVEFVNFVGGDAIDPTISEVKMSVSYQYEPGNFVVLNDINGEPLQDVDPSKAYKAKLDKYGSYRVIYVVTGGNEYGFMLNVRDLTPPVLTWSYALADEYKVGDKVMLSATATDETTTDMEIFYTVSTAKCTIVFFNKPTEYVFTQAGKYVLYAYAYDENGNYGVNAKTITVRN